MTKLETLMLEYAGYSYPVGADEAEREKCRHENAAQLAAAWLAAGADGCRWQWDEDQEADVSWCDAEQLSELDRGDAFLLECVLYGPDGDSLSAIGGVHVTALGDPYCKVTEVELAIEAGYPKGDG